MNLKPISMKSPTLKTPVLGVIYGDRDFLPDQLVTEAHAGVIAPETRSAQGRLDESECVDGHGAVRRISGPQA
jgi:hypothetical protein